MDLVPPLVRRHLVGRRMPSPELMKLDHPICQTGLSGLPYFEQELLTLVHFMCK
jgi:hypothetical protein